MLLEATLLQYVLIPHCTNSSVAPLRPLEVRATLAPLKESLAGYRSLYLLVAW